MLRHGRDVHLMWVKSFTKTLSNKSSGFRVQGQSLKRTLTVTDEKWLTAYAIRGLRCYETTCGLLLHGYDSR